MKRSKRFFLMGLLVLLCGSCVGKTGKMPEDFSLTMEWNTGALPPKYTYMYTITIQPGQVGEMVYRPGYDPEDDSQLWVAAFTPEKAQMEALYATLQEQDMFRNNWKKGEILLGSHGTGLTLNANGKTFEVPSVSELDRDERIQAEAAMDAIRAVVPQALWDELETRQAAYEAEFEE